MNQQMLSQLASQRVSEVRTEAAACATPAGAREQRANLRVRAGWKLIHAGLKLTGPPAPRRHAGPRPAGL
jgi:hypothetical protein